MLTIPSDPKEKFDLRPGPQWSSFEKFRKHGAGALEGVNSGTVAKLDTKTGSYRIMDERDFQALVGLAHDVDRLREGLNVIIVAAEAVEEHHDDKTIATLLRTVRFLTPALPTQAGHDHLEPEGLELGDADDDDVILDRAALRRHRADHE